MKVRRHQGVLNNEVSIGYEDPSPLRRQTWERVCQQGGKQSIISPGSLHRQTDSAQVVSAVARRQAVPQPPHALPCAHAPVHGKAEDAILAQRVSAHMQRPLSSINMRLRSCPQIFRTRTYCLEMMNSI